MTSLTADALALLATLRQTLLDTSTTETNTPANARPSARRICATGSDADAAPPNAITRISEPAQRCEKQFDVHG